MRCRRVLHVGQQAADELRVVEGAGESPDVAGAAHHASDSTCLVVVIDVPRGGRFHADGALTAGLRYEREVLIDFQSVFLGQRVGPGLAVGRAVPPVGVAPDRCGAETAMVAVLWVKVLLRTGVGPRLAGLAPREVAA